MQAMVCGVHCHEGGENCNGYCVGKSESPPAATERQKIYAAKIAAHEALNAAERAWYEYAGLCEVSDERTYAFDVYEKTRTARRR